MFFKSLTFSNFFKGLLYTASKHRAENCIIRKSSRSSLSRVREREKQNDG